MEARGIKSAWLLYETRFVWMVVLSPVRLRSSLEKRGEIGEGKVII